MGEVRIGDAERDRTLGKLQLNLERGRITAEEYSERMEKALVAHFQSDLDRLTSDLPADLQATQRPRHNKWLVRAYVTALVVVLMALITVIAAHP